MCVGNPFRLKAAYLLIAASVGFAAAIAQAQSAGVPLPVPVPEVSSPALERLLSDLNARRKAVQDLRAREEAQAQSRKSALDGLQARIRQLQSEFDSGRRAEELEASAAAGRISSANDALVALEAQVQQQRQRLVAAAAERARLAEQAEKLRQELEARRQAEAAKPVIPPGTEKRVALVMGNARYADRPLRNPVNDSALMARTLQALGFEVQVANDVDRRGMLTALRDFENRARGADVALFYFAGHGAQVGGANYLIPVNAGIRVENDVPDEAIDAASVLRRIEDTRVKVGLVVLDACRDNPYPGASRSTARGLARMSVPTGTIVAYATAPGSTAEDGTGDNGTYTAALARHLAMPGLDIKDIFDRTAQEVERVTNGKQRPREEVGLRGRFALLEAPTTVPAVQMAAASPAAAATTAAQPAPDTAGQGGLPACVAGEAISGRCLATRMPWTRGSLYTGEVWDGRAVGPGKLYFANGDVFTGEFDSMVDDRVNGTGTLKTAEWTYEGALRNGSFHGQGTQRFLDGRPERSGVWVSGRLQSAPSARLAGEVVKEPLKIILDGQEFQAVQEEKRLYEEAVALLRANAFDKAVQAFDSLLRRYPGSGFIHAARYGIGSAYFGGRSHRDAIEFFRQFVADAPEHPRAPDAMLVMSSSQLELKDRAGARRTIEGLIRSYPNSEAALVGRQRLPSLR